MEQQLDNQRDAKRNQVQQGLGFEGWAGQDRADQGGLHGGHL